MRSIFLIPLLVAPAFAQGVQTQDFRLLDFTTQELRVPSEPGQPFVVEVVLGDQPHTLALEPHSVLADDFELLIDDGGELRSVAPPSSATYRGTVAGVADSLVAAQLVGGSLRAQIWLDRADVWEIQPASIARPGAAVSEHLVYRSADVRRTRPVRCGVDHGTQSPVPPGPSSSPNRMTLERVELAIDADYDLVQRNFGDEVGTLKTVTGLINQVDAIYRRDVGITYVVTTIIIRKQPTYTSTMFGALLGEFRGRWNSNHGNIQRDVAHLMTGKSDPGNVIGVAYLSVICSGNRGYGLSEVSFVANGSTAGLIAHELGHNWNANHCNSSSSCNIMCSTLGGCSGALGAFAPVSQSVISSYRNSRNCLDTIPDGSAGTFAAYGTGCAGTNGTPRHVAFGFPHVDGRGYFRVFECPPDGDVFLTIGRSDTDFLGLPLPFDLAVIGAPNCFVLTDHITVVPGKAGSAGRHTIEVPFPTDVSAIGTSWYSQFLSIDPGANFFGLTSSNGYETVIGR